MDTIVSLHHNIMYSYCTPIISILLLLIYTPLLFCKGIFRVTDRQSTINCQQPTTNRSQQRTWQREDGILIETSSLGHPNNTSPTAYSSQLRQTRDVAREQMAILNLDISLDRTRAGKDEMDDDRARKDEMDDDQPNPLWNCEWHQNWCGVFFGHWKAK